MAITSRTKKITFKKPYVICAAIHYDNGVLYPHPPVNIETGIVMCGRRHHNIFPQLGLLFPDREYLGKCVEGFITSDNRFVDRAEAKQIAIDAGQFSGKTIGCKFTSEDIY